MTEASRAASSPRRTSYRALAEAVRIAARADFRHVINRASQLEMLLARLEIAAQALEGMEASERSGDGFEHLGDVARRVVDGLGGKT